MKQELKDMRQAAMEVAATRKADIAAGRPVQTYAALREDIKAAKDRIEADREANE